MGKAGDVRNTARWRRLKVEAKSSLPPVCFRCGGAVDLDLPANQQMGPHLDHKLPLAQLEGTEISPYDMENLAWSHNVCNKRHGARLGGRNPGVKAPRASRTVKAPVIADGEQAPPRIESRPHPDTVRVRR